MTINFLRKEETTITYETSFDETDFENFCEENNIPTEKLTYNECVEVIRNHDTLKTVTTADGDELSIYYLLVENMRETAYAIDEPYHDMHGMPTEEVWVEPDGNDEYE